MSCCYECQSGMGCCDSGLYGLMGALVASGSRVRAGFEYQSNASIAQHGEGQDSASEIQSVLAGAMLGSGVFSQAFVQVNEPAWGGLQHGYITASGTTYADVNDSYEISNLIAGLIQDFLPVLTVTRRDPVRVDYIPPTAVGKAGVEQVYVEQRTQTQQQPGQCDWDKLSFGDYVACQLGISSPIGGVGVGAVGALVAVGIGTLILVAVLKR